MAGKIAQQGKAIFNSVAGSRQTKADLLERLHLSTEKKSKDAKMWTSEEDTMLRNAVEKYGESDWDSIVQAVPGRNKLQCTQRWRKTLKPGLKKGPWAPEEDALLLQVLESEPPGDWQAISRRVPGRNAKQCKERWTLNLNPEINHGPWTPEEDDQLVALHAEIGGKWALLAKRLPGRTEHSIKTRFLSLERQAARIRGWTINEDRIILKHFLQAPHLDGASTTMKHLAGRSKKQVTQRWAHLREKYVSINDLADLNPQGGVDLRDGDLVFLIPDVAAQSAQLLTAALESENVLDEPGKKALPRLHPSSTLSQPSGHDKKKKKALPQGSSSILSLKADTGLSVFGAAYASTEPLPALEILEDSLHQMPSAAPPGRLSNHMSSVMGVSGRSLNIDALTSWADAQMGVPGQSAPHAFDTRGMASAPPMLPFASSGHGLMYQPNLGDFGHRVSDQPFPHETGPSARAATEDVYHRTKSLTGASAHRNSLNSSNSQLEFGLSRDDPFLSLLEETSRTSKRSSTQLPSEGNTLSFANELNLSHPSDSSAKGLRNFSSSLGLPLDESGAEFEDLVSHLQIGGG